MKRPLLPMAAVVVLTAWRRVAFAFVIAIVAAGSGGAEEVAGSDFEIDNGFVRSWADPFTDAYGGTILLLSGDDGSAVRIYHYGGGEFSIQFFGTAPDQEDSTPIGVIWRIDDFDAYAWDAQWSEDDGYASTRVTIGAVDAISDRIVYAARVIYRLGEDGDVQRVRIPYEMPELIAEFRRRVEAS